MLRKDITYEDYNGDEVTDAFYFNMTKVEMLEADLKMGSFEKTLEKLQETSDPREAWDLFKEILLSSVGKKSDDGKRFIKNQELRDAFEQSPAMSELIIEFLKDSNSASTFIEGVLPAKLVAEVKAEQAEQAKKKSDTPELGTAPPVLETETDISGDEEKVHEKKAMDYSRDELLAMSDEEFLRVAGSDPLKMEHPVLVVAMQRKNNSKIASTD